MISNKQLAIMFIAVVTIAMILTISGCTSPTPTPTTVNATAIPTAAPTAGPQQTMKLATTTSMSDSGLLNDILPDFEKANNVKVDVIARGSGEAMTLGQNGDVDVLIAHSPAAEKTFVDNGYGWNRTQFAYNYFIVVGPASDPAGIKGLNASKAYSKIHDAKAPMVARSGTSGTAAKEQTIWNSTGFGQPNNATDTWYSSTGQGMADALRMADQKQAYILTDKSTYLKDQKNLSLVILVDSAPDMINKYDVIEVNQTMHPDVKYDLAQKFRAYLISNETQAKISTYGNATVGQPLFFIGTP